MTDLTAPALAGHGPRSRGVGAWRERRRDARRQRVGQAVAVVAQAASTALAASPAATGARRACTALLLAAGALAGALLLGVALACRSLVSGS